MKKMIIGQLFFYLLPLFRPALSLAQESPQPPLNLNTAVEQALSAYPTVRLVQAQSQAASAGIELARTAYLPRADLIWQQNRATRNNVTGLLLPQSAIPSITGPVLNRTTNQSAWGQRRRPAAFVGTVRFWFAESECQSGARTDRSGPGE